MQSSPTLRPFVFSALRVLALLALFRLALPLFAPSKHHRMDALKRDWSSGAAGPRVLVMRELNAEYDFMARTFLVLALADEALEDPAQRDENIQLMDVIIDDTLATEDREGQAHWLMAYWNPAAAVGTGRSLFVDGEVLVMVTARRLLDDSRPDLRLETERRSALVRSNLTHGPTLGLAESYADEGWLFCHAMALLGLRAEEVLDGVDHSALFDQFESTARTRLLDPDGSGLLVSSFNMQAGMGDGPEGSSIWLASTALAVVLPELAAEQYTLARAALGRSILGLGYSREWSEGRASLEDVDSGPLVPVLEASTSASGFAIAAARMHGDQHWSDQLDEALGAAEALIRCSTELQRWASNPVGDAVIVWGQGVGPLFSRLQRPQDGTTRS